MPMPADFLAVDWGSTRVRAELWREGVCQGRREGQGGVLASRPSDFEAGLAELCGDWIDAHPDLPVVLSGMVGAREGWLELPHLPVPAGLDELAAALAELPSTRWPGRILGVPGLRQVAPVDLMRGEEVQVLGALEGPQACFCLPGTHSKWVRVEGGRITDFRTFLTGELYQALLGLGSYRSFGPEAGGDGPAFEAGLAASAKGLGLLNDLFGARVTALHGLRGAELGSYLSGLLVGHELRSALTWAAAGEILLVGAEALCQPYESGLAALGRPSRRVPEGSHARGIRRLLAGEGWS